MIPETLQLRILLYLKGPLPTHIGWVMLTLSLADPRGRRSRRAPPPLRSKIFLISCSFWEIKKKNVCQHPLLRVGAPSYENPGSAPAYSVCSPYLVRRYLCGFTVCGCGYIYRLYLMGTLLLVSARRLSVLQQTFPVVQSLTFSG